MERQYGVREKFDEMRLNSGGFVKGPVIFWDIPHKSLKSCATCVSASVIEFQSDERLW